jgi:hypothetical protein
MTTATRSNTASLLWLIYPLPCSTAPEGKVLLAAGFGVAL